MGTEWEKMERRFSTYKEMQFARMTPCFVRMAVLVSVVTSVRVQFWRLAGTFFFPKIL